MKLSVFLYIPVFLTLSGVAIANPDDVAIATLLEAQSKAESAFPRTLNIDSVTKIYAADSIRIDNGNFETVESMKKTLGQIEELVNLGGVLGLSSRRVNVKTIPIAAGFVLATFDHTSKIAAAGQVAKESIDKCSALFKKIPSGWQIQHEHCSSVPKENVISNASGATAQ